MAADPARPLRIAAHNGAPEWGGAEIATSLLLSGLQERGHEVVFFYNRPIVRDGARGYGLELRPGYLGGDIAIHHALRFAVQLRRWKPDVLIVGTFRKLWLAALAARLAGVPVVARIGLSTDLPRNLKYRFVFRYLVDAVIPNAMDIERDYRQVLGDRRRPPIRTIHKGIAPGPPTTPAADVRKDLGVPGNGLLIGGVGRLVTQKRFDRLLEAFAVIPPGPRLVLVGEGDQAEALRRKAGELGIADRVRFAGHRSDISNIMNAIDLLVVSSDRESLANVMLEAMAAGTPVVSTRVSGAEEALLGDDDQLGPGGVVVDMTADGLAEAMATLAGDQAQREAMGRAARRRAEERFHRDRMLLEWEAALRAIVG